MSIVSAKTASHTKHQMACHYLKELAHQRGAGAKLPTTVQLRQELGVSITTLDGALREMEAQNVICRKHGSGIYVSPQLQKSIALLCDARFFQGASHSPFWDLLLDVARTRAVSHCELLEVHLVPRDQLTDAPLQRGLAREIEEGSINGIIGIGLVENAVRWIEARGLPFVSLFGPHFARTSAAVTLDHSAFVSLGVESLQKQGCTRVAVWSPMPAPVPRPTADETADEWDVQFGRILVAHNLPCDAALLQLGQEAPARSDVPMLSAQEQGFELACRSFAAPPAQWPDGLVITDDRMTRGVLTALKNLKIEVGRDLRIATHANKNSPVLPATAALTLLEIDPAEIVETTFALLEALMNGQTPSRFATHVPPHARPV